MNGKELPSGKQYVYAFSSRKLVLLVSMVLVLMAISLMLGIRLERYQGAIGFDSTEAAGKQAALAPDSSAGLKVPATATTENAPAEAPADVEAAPADAPPVLEQSKGASPPTPSAPAPAPRNEQVVKQETAPKAPPQKAVAAPPSAPRRETPPAPAPAPQKAQQATVAATGYFAIQVSSSQDKALATHQMTELKSKGFSAYVQDITIEGKGKFYRLLIGPFKTEAEATVILNKLKKDSSYSGSYIRYLS